MASNWSNDIQDAYGGGLGPNAFAFKIRVKAVHYWIRKGNAHKAAIAARTVFHHANIILRLREYDHD